MLEPKNRPDFVCGSAMLQRAGLHLIRDLRGGTRQMRHRGAKYLPDLTTETPNEHRQRIQRALLFNTLMKTLGGLVGMVLKENPVYSVPSLIQPMLDDIDLQGNHADVFWKDAFTDAVAEGHCFLLVDMEEPLPASITSAAPIPDAADEQAAGRRPYVVKYKKDAAVNYVPARINGEIVIQRITFEENDTVPDGRFGEKQEQRYRVFELPVIRPPGPGQRGVYGQAVWSLWRKMKMGISGAELITPYDAGVTTLNRIPVVPLYTRRTGWLESQPPLEDLAELNRGHWQQYSGVIEQLRAMNPILVRKYDSPSGAMSGAQDEPVNAAAGKPAEVKPAPGEILSIYGKDADVFWRSHEGTAFNAAREALIDLENRMSAVGLSIISEKSETVPTATEKLMDQGERVSELATWARGLEDAGSSVFWYMSQYMGLSEGGKLKLGNLAINPDAVIADRAPVPEPPAQPERVM
jgi:hypothetical protein